MVGTLTTLFEAGIQAARKFGALPPSDPRSAELWGQEPTASGASITEDTALNISAVFCAVNLVSNAFMSFPASVFKWAGGTDREVDDAHPAHTLLHRKPNPEMSPVRFMKLLSCWAQLWGNGRAEIERDRRLQPIALWPIHPSRARTKRNAAGAIVHEVYNEDGSMVEIPDSDVLRTMGFSKDGLTGLSVVGCARESLGLTVSAEEYGARFFGNDAVPRAYLKTEKKLDKAARTEMRRTWDEAYGGPNRHKLALIEGGLDLQALGMPNDDAQFLETRKFQTTEVARWFNVPPHMLKDLERATFSNIEHQGIEFVMDSVLPWVLDYEQEGNRKLLTEPQQTTHFCKMNSTARLRGDSAARAKYYQTMTGIGAYSINEVRALEELNGIGPAGDEHYVDMNRTTAEEAASEPTKKEEGTEPVKPNQEALRSQLAEAHKPLLAEAIERMIRIECRAAERASKKATRLEDVQDELGEWAPGFFKKHAEKFRAAVIPPMEALAGVMQAALPEVAADEWAEWIGAHTAALTEQHVEWGCETAYELVKAPAPTEWATYQAAIAVDHFVRQSAARYATKGEQR
jgi:HK97 family phage portal protein